MLGHTSPMVRFGTAPGQEGEIGHLVVDAQGERCRCGQIGCLEVYVSGWGLSHRYERVSGIALPAEAIFERAEGSEANATHVVDDARRALARAVVAVSVMVDPRRLCSRVGLSPEPANSWIR